MGRKISNRKKIAELVWECYREMYREATPSADFDKLVEEAPLNERNERVVDYMAYYLAEDKYNAIRQKYLDMISDKSYYKKSFTFEIAFGCSPTCSEVGWKRHLQGVKNNKKE